MDVRNEAQDVTRDPGNGPISEDVLQGRSGVPRLVTVSAGGHESTQSKYLIGV
jgi:hypothetical protein